MPAPHHPSNVDQLRQDIDRGRNGDKVDYPDPAAAPLGTDAEAAGAAPSADEIALEHVSRNQSERRGRVPGITIYSVVAMAVSASILVAAAVGAA